MGQRFFEDFTPPTRSHTGTTFPIDAIFMPVKRVNFTIRENLGEGEYIYFELWTNGSLHPLQALRSAAKVCMKVMGACLQCVDLQPSLTDDLEPGTPGATVPVQYTKSEALPKFESIPIEQLELSLRAYNCLKRAQILTLADLAQQSCSDLLSLRNFGQKSAEEVRAALRTYGIELKQ
jgi:DNA-directed RNA polymerase subunit alpha